MTAGNASQWQENLSDMATQLDLFGARADAAVNDPTNATASLTAFIKGTLKPNTDNYVLLASVAVTQNGSSFDASNFACRGVKIFITTGVFGSGSSAITVTIQGKDPVSGAYYNILTSPSLTASKDISSSAANLLTIYPGLTPAANSVVSDVLPPTWRVTYQATSWGTGGSTLGIACAMIV